MTRSRLSGRPILGTRADHDLFVGREPELAAAARALDQGLNCALVADPGAGRTSMLYRLLSGFDDPVLVRGATVDTAAGLLVAVLNSLSERVGTTADIRPEAPAVAAMSLPASESLGTAVLIDRLRTAVGPDADTANPVIAIDDIPAEAGLELFGRYRDELWTVPARWLGTVSTTSAVALLRPPADVFFDVQIPIPPLSDKVAADLLDRRIPGGDDAHVGQIVSAAGGNPRRLIELARELAGVDPAVVASATAGVLRRTARIDQLPAPARMLARELEALGGASASDPVLLDRLGWTRSRAVQVLKELETAGVVVASESRDGPGRPRKVYRLI